MLVHLTSRNASSLRYAWQQVAGLASLSWSAHFLGWPGSRILQPSTKLSVFNDAIHYSYGPGWQFT